MRSLPLLVFVTSLLTWSTGCTPLRGVPSLTVVTRDLPADSDQFEWVGERVEETEAFNWALVLALYGQAPTHESVVARLLEKHDADVLLDAELTSWQFGIPYVFLRTGTTAEGRPARYKGRSGR